MRMCTISVTEDVRSDGFRWEGAWRGASLDFYLFIVVLVLSLAVKTNV